MAAAASPVIVIGAGPAGAACALWLDELGHAVTLLEKNDVAGGLQNFSPYENIWLPGLQGLQGREVAQRIHEQMLKRKIPLQTGVEVRCVARAGSGYDVTLSDNRKLHARYVVLATGTRFRAGKFIPSPNVSIGPGRNFEALAIEGKTLAILGGGDNAFDAYRFAQMKNVKACKIFARNLRVQRKLRAMVPASDVIIGEYHGEQNSMHVNGTAFDLFAVQYGFEPVVPAGLESLHRTPYGTIEADMNGCTSLEGLYAIGEVAGTFHPCVTTSYAHGIQAAKHIQRCLEA